MAGNNSDDAGEGASAAAPVGKGPGTKGKEPNPAAPGEEVEESSQEEPWDPATLEQKEGATEGLDEYDNPLLMFYRTPAEKKLIKHKPIDNVDWRDEPKKVAQAIQRRAAFAQQLAEAAPKGHACGLCRKGYGPFKTCRYAIVDGQLLFTGSCTNCAWGGSNSRCDTHKGPLPKWLGDRLFAANPDAAELKRGIEGDEKAAAPATPDPKGKGRATSKRGRETESSSKASEEPLPKRTPGKVRASPRTKKGDDTAGPDYPRNLYKSVMDDKDVRTGNWPMVRTARREVEELQARLKWEHEMITAVLAAHGEENSPEASDEEEFNIFAGMKLK
ncbi:hypothetical protein N7486_000546 [Penicillium sp. IBT 16267x]|nr:hypothetical protein N7486_000546 [Penicillium sp. IBT 16267x]